MAAESVNGGNVDDADEDEEDKNDEDERRRRRRKRARQQCAFTCLASAFAYIGAPSADFDLMASARDEIYKIRNKRKQ